MRVALKRVETTDCAGAAHQVVRCNDGIIVTLRTYQPNWLGFFETLKVLTHADEG